MRELGFGVACAVVTGLLGLGCGSSSSSDAPGTGLDGGDVAVDDGGADVAAEVAVDASTWASGPHDDPPQVVSSGGPVLTTPTVVPIVYTGEAYETQLHDLATALSKSTYWAATTAEYGVGPLAVGDTQHIPGAAPTTLSDANLVGALKTGFSSGGFGTPDGQTIYTFFVPKGTALSDSGKCCQDFDGYHAQTVISGTPVPYAVVCGCGGAFDGPGITDDDQIAAAFSHELIEAATDPFPQNEPAYEAPDDAHVAWMILAGGGGELSDMCEYEANAFATVAGVDAKLSRSWSNVAAAAGLDPCVPAPDGEVYFSAMPVLPDTVSLNDGFGTSTSTKGVTIPVGSSKTIDVQLFSAGPTSGPWKVKAEDASALNGGKAYLYFAWDKTVGSNGDTLHLTITVKSADTTNHGEVFVLTSELGGVATMQVGAVGQ